jgi:hypothetical protein
VPVGQRRDHVEEIGWPRRGTLDGADLHLHIAVPRRRRRARRARRLGRAQRDMRRGYRPDASSANVIPWKRSSGSAAFRSSAMCAHSGETAWDLGAATMIEAPLFPTIVSTPAESVRPNDASRRRVGSARRSAIHRPVETWHGELIPWT